MEKELRYKYNIEYEHHRSYNILTRLGIFFLWIVLIVWFIYEVLSAQISAIGYIVIPWIAVIITWKQLLCAIILLRFSFGKIVKEKCDAEISINQKEMSIIYKKVKFKYEDCPKYVDVKEVYKIENIKRITPMEGKIKLLCLYELHIYDADGRKISKENIDAINNRGRIVYVPVDYIMEVYKHLNKAMKNQKEVKL